MTSYLEYVNAKIGSKNEPRFSNGNIYPVVSMPFGMANFTIQSNGGEGSWFYTPDSRILEGIRLTHQPSPWVGDYGHILMLPFTDKLHENVNCRWSSYRIEDAVIRPDYLRIFELRYRLDVQLVPTTRGCLTKMISNELNVNIAFLPFANSSFELKNTVLTGYTDSQSIWGFKRIREYFYVEFTSNPTIENIENDGVALYFNEKQVEMRFSTSFVSIDQAKQNFIQELKDKAFDDLKNDCTKIWEEQLSKIQVSNENVDRTKTFYSCLYRTLLYPRKFYEITENNEIVHYNADTDKVEKGVFYTDNGFWDTYRTVYPLLSITQPEIVREMIEGFINYYEETGWLPKWLSPSEIGIMPGTLVEAVIADACVKGIVTGELRAKAYKAMLKSAYESGGKTKHGRKGLTEYIKYGYIPNSITESVNNTEDCAYGDYCISQVALLEGDTVNHEKLLKRSKSYSVLFDKECGFLRSKDEEGKFPNSFDKYGWGGDYCEGGPYQNSFATYHDIEGLAVLFGGKEKLKDKLDELFSEKPIFNVGGYGFEIHEMSEMASVDFGQCAISNQPSFHLPWIYSKLGYMKKTKFWVEKLVNEAFTWKDDGFPGDEDNGTMAGWYIFSCLGFYPMCPGKDEYVVSKPLFNEIKINGKKIKEFTANTITSNEIFGK